MSLIIVAIHQSVKAVQTFNILYLLSNHPVHYKAESHLQLLFEVLQSGFVLVFQFLKFWLLYFNCLQAVFTSCAQHLIKLRHLQQQQVIYSTYLCVSEILTR